MVPAHNVSAAACSFGATDRPIRPTAPIGDSSSARLRIRRLGLVVVSAFWVEDRSLLAFAQPFASAYKWVVRGHSKVICLDATT